MAGSAAFMSRNGAVRFTSSAERHSSAVRLGKRVESASAALLTRTSIRPKRLSVICTISSATLGAAISPGTAKVGSPIDAARLSARARSRTFTATAAPRSWKRSAAARPSPRQAPVTMTTRPAKSCADGWLLISESDFPIYSDALGVTVVTQNHDRGEDYADSHARRLLKASEKLKKSSSRKPCRRDAETNARDGRAPRRSHSARAPNVTGEAPALLFRGRSTFSLLLVQIILFEELGPELLWRSRNVRPPLRSKVHQIPIRPDRVDMIHHSFSSPEMKNLSILLPEDMHHRQLHVIRVFLAFVIGLIGRLESGNQRNL